MPTKRGSRSRPAPRRAEPPSRYERIRDIVRRIPRGRVATYGQIAAIAGLPGHARQVGYALHALPEHTSVPWHRVVNAKGELSLGRIEPGGALRQRFRLEAEGVAFGAKGRIALAAFGWRVRNTAKSRRG